MTDLSAEEREIAAEAMELHLSPETIAGIIQRRRACVSQSEKVMVWRNFRKIWDDVLKFREIERRRHVETNPERAARRQDRPRW